VEAMLKEGVIRPSQSNWTAPVLLVRKKMACGGSALIAMNSTRLQRIVTLLVMQMKDSMVFVSTSGNWQLPMVPGASEMAAFMTKHGLYKLVVMPFGLTNALAMFQQMRDSMILEVQGKWV